MAVTNRGMLESLIACGALDSTGATRQGMMEVLERALANGQKTQADAMVGQGSIFDLEGDGMNGSGPIARSHQPVVGEEWPRDELLRREKEVLGLYVSSHPLAPLRDQLAPQGGRPAEGDRGAARRQGDHGRRHRLRACASC